MPHIAIIWGIMAGKKNIALSVTANLFDTNNPIESIKDIIKIGESNTVEFNPPCA